METDAGRNLGRQEASGESFLLETTASSVAPRASPSPSSIGTALLGVLAVDGDGLVVPCVAITGAHSTHQLEAIESRGPE